MRWEAKIRTWRAVSPVVIGCLLGAATAVGTAVSFSAPAYAACTGDHVHVQGWDFDQTPFGASYGNYGINWVNGAGTLDNLTGAIYHSIFVQASYGDNVEVGWTADSNGHAGPNAYAEWVNDGVQAPPQYSVTINPATHYQFWMDNVNDDRIWSFYFDGKSVAL
jgi:hypothetical protein